MQRMQFQFPGGSPHPLKAAIAFVVGLGTLALLFFFSLVAAGVVLVGGVIFGLYWKAKSLFSGKRPEVGSPHGRHSPSPGQVIEGEYSVIEGENQRRD